jgi:hypothetical protein
MPLLLRSVGDKMNGIKKAAKHSLEDFLSMILFIS